MQRGNGRWYPDCRDQRGAGLCRWPFNACPKTADGYKVYKKRRAEGAGKKTKTMWVDSKYDASSHGIMLIRNMFGLGDFFSYPKSINTVQDALFISGEDDG